MTDLNALSEAGLFDKNVPRYTSYPTAPHFHADVGGPEFAFWLETLDISKPVSLYIHIPFCERLCWFCACRTQGVTTLSPVEAYVDVLLEEIAMFKATRPEDLKLGRLHFGGGSPTILTPELIDKLMVAILDATPFDADYEFSVEIDPTACNDAKIEAFARGGMNRASIGVQDFNPKVQEAIGRPQSYELTRDTVESLRRHGINSVNIDMVYGLPHQGLDELKNTVDLVQSLAPDRVALFGYAHVPWMAKRQKMIPEESLPGAHARFEQAETAAEMFAASGMDAIGIDHFAKPEDSLAIAARNGHLRRNFQGYTDDRCIALIGLGASSISRFPQGYIQNNAATTNYIKSITSGDWSAAKGFSLGIADQVRARAIETLMCDFEIDLKALTATYGDFSKPVQADCMRLAEEYQGFVAFNNDRFVILPEGRALTRIIASGFDAFNAPNHRHSSAI
ncbi:MAG TPA: oxygen-independent coproporphyrinogen III oxidase [Rhodobacteraceae bacterium]|nr:oxygen-independent coproporphyrinogen III oxidase [Paracoccaceae bacterium]